jgi:hypothetical protein
LGDYINGDLGGLFGVVDVEVEKVGQSEGAGVVPRR